MDPKTVSKAYSQFEIKAVDEKKRQIRGIATTPSVDRVGDIVLPEGAKFTLPVPFLWQHDHLQPIGNVIEAKVTKKGIEVLIELVQLASPSRLAARLDEAWESIRSGLVRGLSIGFSPLKYAFMENGGIEFSEWSFNELSAVTVPCNQDATITAIKALSAIQAASGQTNGSGVVVVKTVGVPTTSNTPLPSEGRTMNITEQLAAFRATLEQKKSAAHALLVKSGAEGRTFDETEKQEYDQLEHEIEATEAHISRLEKYQAANVAKATPVGEPTSTQAAAAVRAQAAPAVVRSVKNDEPGITFIKFALSMYAAKGDLTTAKNFAEAHYPGDIRVQNAMKAAQRAGGALGTSFVDAVSKAAVAAGTTSDSDWAGDLVDYRNMSSEFIEYLRPRTIVGRFGANGIPSLRRVPFNVRIPGKISAGTAGWVGEGARKPVTASGYDATELKWSKIAAISVVTDELARFADPSIQMLVREDLAEAVIERMDIDFVDPGKVAGTGVGLSPASVTNGVTPIPSSGNDAESIRADIADLWAVADSTNLPTGSAVYITDSRTARRVSMMRNALGQLEFPGMSVAGGTLDGIPVIVSNYVPADTSGSLFILAFTSEIYLADDGVVTVDISREATIFMDSAAQTETPTASQLVNMFQTNQMAIRAERYVHWKKRRPQAVAYLNGVNWGVTGV